MRFWMLIVCFWAVAESKLDDFINADAIVQDHYKKAVCNVENVNRHVRRYVNTFLRYTKLSDKELLNKVNDNSYVYVDLNLKLTGRQLRTLQNAFHRNEIPSLEDLDDIFSNIMYNSVSMEASRTLQWLSSYFIFTYRSLDVSIPQLLSLGIVSTFFFRWFMKGFSKQDLTYSACLLLGVEGLKTYLFKLREANVKFYLEMKRQNNLHEECDLSGAGLMTWAWVSLKNCFRPDPCFQTYMHSTAHYAENVSLIDCLLESYLKLTSLFMRYMGVWVKELSIGAIGTGYVAQILAALIYPFTMLVVVGMVYYAVFGAQLRLSTLLATLGVSSPPPPPAVAPTEPPPAVQNNELILGCLQVMQGTIRTMSEFGRRRVRKTARQRTVQGFPLTSSSVPENVLEVVSTENTSALPAEVTEEVVTKWEREEVIVEEVTEEGDFLDATDTISISDEEEEETTTAPSSIQPFLQQLW